MHQVSSISFVKITTGHLFCLICLLVAHLELRKDFINETAC